MNALRLVGILLLFCSHQILHAQWVRTGGPVSGTVTCFVGAGGSLYAGTGTGVFRSTDRGGTWSEVISGLWDVNVRTLAVDGANLFAGTASGVYRSTDGGESWTLTGNGVPKVNVACLAAVGSCLIAGSADFQGIFRSTDYGSTWVQVLTENLTNQVYTIASLDTCIFAGTLEGIFRSPDSGATWAAANTGYTDKYGNPYDAVSFAAVDSVLFVAGAYNNGIFRSTDHGATWSPTACTWGVSALAASGTTLFAGSTGDVARSTDGGRSWQHSTVGANRRVAALGVSGHDLYAGTEAEGVFLSTDGGVTWIESNKGLVNVPICSLVANRGTLFATSLDTRKLYRSSDAGDTWQSLAIDTLTFSHQRNLEMTVSDGSLYLTAGVIYRSIDNGETWQALTSGLYDSLARGPADFRTLLVAGSDLYAATQWVVFHSPDAGSHWTQSVVVAGGSDIGPLAMVGDVLVASFSASSKGGSSAIVCSTDGGKSWSATSGKYAASAFAVRGTRLFAGSAYRSVMVSADSGKTWSEARSGLPPTYWVNAFCFVDSSLFVSLFRDDVHRGGVYMSTNSGANWAEADTGLAGMEVSAFATTALSLYAATAGTSAFATGGGVWRRPLSELIASAEGTTIRPSGDYWLGQNYPNPFNPSTTIRFSLPHRAHVALTVFNMLGQRVAEIVNGEIDAGYHTVQFNAKHLASGVYFYRLQAGSFVDVKKMLVTK